ncbi:hypothetical protein NDU88_003604 [Pleurodeles waltl]|uniref:Uncharacterized protein n=1 Tax=Pleurodeles waltl TaxID=8319 RepID=A0AAV7SGE7_PLEWA|nr:hypothetical protein NDU88_003604 [Pleurodeles waltl]
MQCASLAPPIKLRVQRVAHRALTAARDGTERQFQSLSRFPNRNSRRDCQSLSLRLCREWLQRGTPRELSSASLFFFSLSRGRSRIG